MEFLDSIRQIRTNVEPYKLWDQEQKNKDLQRQHLHKTIQTPKDKLDIAQGYGQTVIDAVNVMDEYSESKSQDVEQATEGVVGMLASTIPLAFLPALSKTQVSAKSMILQNTAMPIAVGVASIAGMIWASTQQKQASRIARYQAREKELKDPRNFVVYTQEQIQQAKEIAKSMPVNDDKKKHALAEMVSTIKSLKNDQEGYNNWKKNYKNTEAERNKLLNIDVTPEQLAKAKSDQEILSNTIKKIDMTAEEYSENVESAISTVPALSFIPGFALGGLAWKLTGILEKQSKLPKWLGKAPKPVASAITTFLLPVAVGLYGLSMQKESSRVGRFKAKKELLSDPHNFINYEDKQMQSVSNIKAPVDKKGFFSGIKDDMKFFFTSRKDFKEYKDYKKNQEKEDKKFREALKQIKIDSAQLEEAKKLQEKSFRMFEKMDEMSQRYSEDMETATQIGQQLLGFIMPITIGVVALAGVILHKRGFFSLEKGGKLLNRILHGKNSEAHKSYKEIVKVAKDKNLSISELIKNTKNLNSDTINQLIENPELSSAFNKYISEVGNIWQGRYNRINKRFGKLIEKHPKIGEYFNNLKSDIADIFGNNGFSFNKHTTVRNTVIGVAAGILVPLLTLYTASIYAFQTFLTKLQKQAGRIGLMKAMEDLKNPRNFVDFTEDQKRQANSFSGQNVNNNYNKTNIPSDMSNWLNNIGKSA